MDETIRHEPPGDSQGSGQPERPSPSLWVIRVHAVVCFLLLPVFFLFLSGLTSKQTALIFLPLGFVGTGLLTVWITLVLESRPTAGDPAVKSFRWAFAGRMIAATFLIAVTCLLPMACTHLQLVFTKGTGGDMFVVVKPERFSGKGPASGGAAVAGRAERPGSRPLPIASGAKAP